MAILEKVMQMKQQGMDDAQIVGFLRQEGISPKEINDALSQSKIKSALNSGPEVSDNSLEGYGGSMEQSMMQSGQSGDYGSGPGYSQGSGQSPPEYPPQQEYVQPIGGEQGQQEEQAQGYSEYSPEYGGGQAYSEYQPRPEIDLDTINEICEQTVEEKTDKLKKEISSFTKFKEDIDFDVQKMNERLTRIENSFNELQMAILRKIGSYGDDIKNISKEMYATQESFSKMLDPLTDNIRALQNITGKDSSLPEKRFKDEEVQDVREEAQRKPLKKPKTDFESYLR